MHARCGNWATNEETSRARGRLRPPHVRVQGDQPDRRALRAALRARGAARPRSAPAALGDARRAALVPGAARLLECFRGARQSHCDRMGRRAAAARGPVAHVRFLPERAAAAPVAARRSARGAVRCLWRSLARLSGAGDASVVLRAFEKRLLAELGYAPILDRDAASRPIDPERLYAYEPERGPTVVSGSRGDLPVVRGRTLLDVAADDYSSPKTREEARNLMRVLIGERLHGQILHTRTVLRELSDL